MPLFDERLGGAFDRLPRPIAGHMPEVSAWDTAPRDREAPSLAAACRFCGASLSERVAELGLIPLDGDLLPPGADAGLERCRPLRVLVCSDCRLVQRAGAGEPPAGRPAAPPRPGAGRVAAQGQAWAERLVCVLRLGADAPIIELGAAEGALGEGLRRLGLSLTAAESLEPDQQRTRLLPASFGAAQARRLRAIGPPPALIVAHDLPARTADLHGLVEGVRTLLAPGGVAAFELRHLLRVIQAVGFGAFRHDLAAYPSLLVAELILGQHGLVIFDVEEAPEGGGILRLLARHVEDTAKPVTGAVGRLRAEERLAGLEAHAAYARFARAVVETKWAMLDFLVEARRGGRRVVAYGASAEAVTLLNACGAGPELLSCVVDPDPARQGLLLPGVRLPVRAPAEALGERPDTLLILPGWPAKVVMAEMAALRAWGGRFVVVAPKLRLV